MPRGATPALIAALQAQTVRLVIFVEGYFLTTTLRLWSGIGKFQWNGVAWEGAGELLKMSPAQETADMKAIGFTISLAGMDEAVIYAALAELRQGQRVNAYLGAMDENFNLIQDPHCFFSGRVDIPIIDDGADTATISLQIENLMIDFERSRVRYYDPTTQAIFFPGDKGFDYVAPLQNQKIFWGVSN